MKKKLKVLGRLTDMTFSVTLFRALKFKYQKHLYRKPPMILKTLPKLLYNKYIFLDIFPDSY